MFGCLTLLDIEELFIIYTVLGVSRQEVLLNHGRSCGVILFVSPESIKKGLGTLLGG